jgi:N-methylhydantoinase A
VSAIDPVAANARLAEMRDEALAVVAPAALACGITLEAVGQARLLELRYAGQGHELRVALPEGDLDRTTLAALAEAFEAQYERVYGLRIPGSEVELVTWSLTLSTAPAPAGHAEMAPPQGPAAPSATRDVWEPALGRRAGFGVYWRFDLEPARPIVGPALVVEDETTTVVPSGWSAGLDSLGNLVMEADA